MCCSSYGDLDGIMRKYDQMTEYFRGQTLKNVEEKSWIPEAFLWSVFENLCIAGILMERGAIQVNDDDGVQIWNTIVHRDLRTSNVFVGTNTSDLYRGFPTAKLGDFGLSLEMEIDQDPKKFNNYFGPWGFMPGVSENMVST